MAPAPSEAVPQLAPPEMAAPQVTFKLVFRRDLRRWTPPGRLTYEAFARGIRSAYELPSDCQLCLTYADVDGDQVTVASEADMQELYLQGLPLVRCVISRSKSVKRALAEEHSDDAAAIISSEPVKKHKAGVRPERLVKLQAKAANGNLKAQSKLESLSGANPSGDCAVLFSKLSVDGEEKPQPASGDEHLVAGSPDGDDAAHAHWGPQRVRKFASKLSDVLTRLPHRQRPVIRVINMLNNCADNLDPTCKGRVVSVLKRGGKRNPAVAKKLALMSSDDARADLPVQLSPSALKLVAEALAMLSGEVAGEANEQTADAKPIGPWKPQRVDKFVAKLSEFLPRVDKRQPALVKVCKMLNNCHAKLDEGAEVKVAEALVAAAKRNVAVAEKLRLLALDPASLALPVSLAPRAQALLLKALDDSAPSASVVAAPAAPPTDEFDNAVFV